MENLWFQPTLFCVPSFVVFDISPHKAINSFSTRPNVRKSTTYRVFLVVWWCRRNYWTSWRNTKETTNLEKPGKSFSWFSRIVLLLFGFFLSVPCSWHYPSQTRPAQRCVRSCDVSTYAVRDGAQVLQSTGARHAGCVGSPPDKRLRANHKCWP